MTNIKKLARICGDLCIFIFICAAELALHKWGKPVKRGFFCNDDSLRYPYRPSTISIDLLSIIVLGLPTGLIVLVELCRCINDADGSYSFTGTTTSASTPTQLQRHHQQRQQQPQHYGYRLWQRLRHCYKYIGYYLIGLALTVFATELAKYSIGRLRPHFFSLCQPQLPDGSTCADEKNHGQYIEEYQCTRANLTTAMLHELNLSFPSGHASVMFYAMFYVTLYVQCMCSTLATKLLKHLLQFAAIMFAWYVSLTRITDFWHHWSDVLIGIFLGCSIAAIIGRFVAEFFGYRCKGGCQRRRRLFNLQQQVHSQYQQQQQQQQQIRPISSAKSSPTTTTIPAYTFGSMQLQHNQQQQHHQLLQHLAQQQQLQQQQQQQQQAQSIYGNASAYANYGYVP